LRIVGGTLSRNGDVLYPVNIGEGKKPDLLREEGS